MNSVIEGKVVKVKRGNFVNKETGEAISYCKFYILTHGVTNENECGYDYEGLSCKVDHYQHLVSLIKSDKPVKVVVDYVKTKDNTYRRVPRKVDDYSL